MRFVLTHFEHLSNELIYEIFDYLDFYHIHQSFLNLNVRFSNLIDSLSFPIKINLSSILKSIHQFSYEQLIIPYQNHLTFLHISNPFLINVFPFPFEKMIRLQTLILQTILSQLSHLPCLFSLVSKPIDTIENSNSFYRQIFHLPVLKYCNITLIEGNRAEVLPFATCEEFSSIETLLINHYCSIDQFNALLSYVSQIRHVSCRLLSKRSHNQPRI